MREESDIIWTAGFLNERFSAPVSPLGWSYVGSLVEEIALREPLRFMGYPFAETIPLTRLCHGHPYANVEVFQILYNPFPDALLPEDAVRYFPEGKVELRRAAPYPRSWFNPRFLPSLLFHLLKAPLNSSPLNYLKWQRFIKYFSAAVSSLSAQLESSNSLDEFLSVVEQARALDAQLLRIHRWSLTYADLFYKLLSATLGSEAQHLVSNVPNKTNEVNSDLAKLARLRASSNNKANEQFEEALTAFLARHGHRSYSLDIAQPTFADDPSQILLLTENPLPEQSSSSISRPMSGAAKTNPFLRPLVYLAREYAALREDQRYYWQMSLALVRRAYLRIGTLLSVQSTISDPDNIFYSTRQEINDLAAGLLAPSEFSNLVVSRREEWRLYWEEYRRDATTSYPPFLRGDAELPRANRVPPKPREWRGKGVSPGVARGVARVVRDPSQLKHVQTGDILIAPSTDPAWTAVFSRLAGLALERGGILSHGAVVAREYHLPAVTGIIGLTNDLADGEWIQVDGTAGTVERIEAP